MAISNNKSTGKLVLLALLVLLFSECNSDSNGKCVSFTLQKIVLKCDTTGNEMGRIIFELQAKNDSDKPIKLTYAESSDAILPIRCFLVSNKIFPDALDLLIKDGSNGQELNAGESRKITALLDYDKLKYTISRYTNKTVSFNDVQNFLNVNENYSLIYTNSKDSTSNWVSKLPALKVGCNP